MAAPKNRRDMGGLSSTHDTSHGVLFTNDETTHEKKQGIRKIHTQKSSVHCIWSGNSNRISKV